MSGSFKQGSRSHLQFHSEEPFVDDVSQAIYDPSPVEVEARRRFVLQGMKTGATGEGVPGKIKAVPAQVIRRVDDPE